MSRVRLFPLAVICGFVLLLDAQCVGGVID
jgi:hypothetical protein